jgi:beta-glucosidase
MNITTAATATESAAGAATDPIDTLPSSFRWGVATSSYQIEGAVDEDGRTWSIWDTFCRVPDAVHKGDNGDIACDHYHRMPQDVQLIKSLGVDTYRFSVAWPRVQPHGRGPVNPAGLAFYDRLVDELLANGIDPWVTLYHWDLPQELEDAGGWPVRDTAYRFADYAMMVFDKLQDRVATWTTMNEPWCSGMLGYAYGAHAPGRRDFEAGIHAVHHLLLGHGLATQRMREASTAKKDFGLTLNLGTATPETDSHLDHEAARRADALGLRMYMDPLVYGRYPEDLVADLAQQNITIPVQEGDLGIISTKFEVLGVNFYTGNVFSGVDEAGNSTDGLGVPISRVVPRQVPVTAMGWEIVPEEFTKLLVRLSQDYPNLPIVITENGAAFDDEADERDYVADDDRTSYLNTHIQAVARARSAGADIRGYFAWSLMDNFEWAYGYDKRFGIVRVNYDTQERVVKQSGEWFRDTIRRVRGH